MARKGSPTILQEELYPPSAETSRSESPRGEYSRATPREESPRALHGEDLDDARLVDLDVAEESPFLRGQKRVSARRSTLPKKTASRLLWAAVAASVLCAVVLIAASLYRYGERSWRFRVESSDNIEIIGMQNATKAQIMEVMGADIGRNIFFIPLAQQKAQLEQIPWVESASVMRFVPNRLKVEIHERTPVAFARVGPRISLIDAVGTLMELPRNRKYSFPVVLGMNPGEPLSTRTPRMKAYNELVQELDSSGAHYSQDLSEVDLSDLDDLKVRVNDPAGDVLVELGSSDYLKRYKTYVSHVQEWRQQFQKLESVNLRYDNQVIVNPDMEGRPKQAGLTAAAAKAAAAAGVKPAALVTKLGPNQSDISQRALPKPAFELSKTTLESAAGKKPVTKAKPKKNSAAHAKVTQITSAQAKSAQVKAGQKNADKWSVKNPPKQVAKAAAGPISSNAVPAAQKADTKKPGAKKPDAKKIDAKRADAKKPDAKKPVHFATAAVTPKPSPAIAKPSAGVN